MLTLHVEAANFSELKIKVEQAMGVSAPLHTPAPEAPAPDKKKPGRPAKTAAPAPVAPKPATPAGEVVTEPQAQVGNSASAAPATPSGTTAPSEAPSVSESRAAASDVTFDDVKAKLQAVAAQARPGDKEGDALNRVTAIIAKYGYRKVKEIGANHFAPIVVDCDQELAA